MIKEPNAPNRKSWVSRIVSLGVIVAMVFSGYSLYQVMTLKPGQKTTVVPGVTVQKPKKVVQDTYITEDAQLMVVYTDGTTAKLGSWKPKDGKNGVDGSQPSQAQITLAVNDYCASGVCNAKQPTPDQVAVAVSKYCTAHNGCAGANGTDGKNGQDVTPDMIAVAVASYCDANNRCAGANGTNGTNGADGQPPLSWKFSYNNTDFECNRVPDFDPNAPKYSCTQVVATTTPPTDTGGGNAAN